ncbi:MAG TPA: hypothetical protein VHZ76_05025 [Gammaproteobacteria bacterium]|nr:hypothetical protein [Gammaproteobacteria bacterium]
MRLVSSIILLGKTAVLFLSFIWRPFSLAEAISISVSGADSFVNDLWQLTIRSRRD